MRFDWNISWFRIWSQTQVFGYREASLDRSKLNINLHCTFWMTNEGFVKFMVSLVLSFSFQLKSSWHDLTQFCCLEPCGLTRSKQTESMEDLKFRKVAQLKLSDGIVELDDEDEGRLPTQWTNDTVTSDRFSHGSSSKSISLEMLKEAMASSSVKKQIKYFRRMNNENYVRVIKCKRAKRICRADTSF